MCQNEKNLGVKTTPRLLTKTDWNPPLLTGQTLKKCYLNLGIFCVEFVNIVIGYYYYYNYYYVLVVKQKLCH